MKTMSLLVNKQFTPIYDPDSLGKVIGSRKRASHASVTTTASGKILLEGRHRYFPKGSLRGL